MTDTKKLSQEELEKISGGGQEQPTDWAPQQPDVVEGGDGPSGPPRSITDPTPRKK